MRIPEGIESIKVMQSQESRNTAATPPKGIESVHSVPPYDIKSHQSLYSEKVFT